jgi:hypothetical protein
MRVMALHAPASNQHRETATDTESNPVSVHPRPSVNTTSILAYLNIDFVELDFNFVRSPPAPCVERNGIGASDFRDP